MNCKERELAIEAFIASLPLPEHEWINVSTSSTEESYICSGCLTIGTMKIQPGDKNE